ncbi:MAG: DNA mismatch repair protein MutS [Flavitalea sp.]
MEVDSTTYNDLHLFHPEEEFSIFRKLNFTKTAEGKEWLLNFFRNPFSDARLIVETQNIVKLIQLKMQNWPGSISNGTVMVMAKFYESGIDSIPASHDFINSMSYKLLHAPDFALLRYSLTHFADFLHGIKQLLSLFEGEEIPPTLERYLLRTKDLIENPMAEELAAFAGGKVFSPSETIRYGRFIRHAYKNQAFELINIYGRLDAWYSMAAAVKHYNLCMPEISAIREPFIQAKGLYHVLLPNPVPYDIQMNVNSNFIFLTGANMAGKSTFIKAVGSAVFLAHLGMGVPAKQMTITVFDGLLSNINVVDNILKGESYFFNEVQRIKNTIVKINDNRKWLVLIDELFKGTNVQDAMKCSSTVIRGLTKITNSLFIMSTHLYEISEELKDFSNISFKYFETAVKEEELEFSYQLKDGVSNDRIGYVILKREKVVDMLENL